MKDIKELPKQFFITYYAKTHNGEEIKGGGKFITRKASAYKQNGVDRFIYWDFDALNKKTNDFGDWRHATGQWSFKAI